jgi:hypothetical protein
LPRETKRETMVKLLDEDILLEEIDAILYESYPSVFLELSSSDRSRVSKYLHIGPNSKQKHIPVEDMFNVEYKDKVVIMTTKDYHPIEWFYNGKHGEFGNFEYPNTFTTEGNARRLTIFKRENNVAFVITPDESTKFNQGIRKERGNDLLFANREALKNIKGRIDKYILIKHKQFSDIMSKIALDRINAITAEWKKNVENFNVNDIEYIRKSGPRHGKAFDKDKDNTKYNKIKQDYADSLAKDLGVPEDLEKLELFIKTKIKEYSNGVYDLTGILQHTEPSELSYALRDKSSKLNKLIKSLGEK